MEEEFIVYREREVVKGEGTKEETGKNVIGSNSNMPKVVVISNFIFMGYEI